MLNYRFTRSTTSGCISDVYDGELYQEQAEFFSEMFNVSFSLNYDGAPKFKSSGVQVWPILLYMNELPPAARYIHSYYSECCLAN